MEEKEVAFPIDKFSGINRNIDREKMSPMNLWSAQNLWEKTLNVLETRGGSEEFATFPSNVVKTLGVKKLYKTSGDHCRLVGVQCTPDLATSFSLPTGFAVSFVTDATGYWNKAITIGGLAMTGLAQSIYIRFVGYGVDKWSSAITVTGISGYSAATNQKLRVTISAAQNENITGYEIYVAFNNGISATPVYKDIWAGFKSLIGVTSATHDFKYVPLGQTAAAANQEIGEVKRIITPIGLATGGTLIGGKTYYVACVPLNCKFTASGATNRNAYSIRDVNRAADPAIVAVTIPGTATTGSIDFSTIDIVTGSFVAAIGETPDLLQPVSLYNDSANHVPIITDYPFGSPAVFDFPYFEITPATEDALFRMSVYSVQDMFAKVDDDGVATPVFHGRMSFTKATLDIRADLEANIADWLGSKTINHIPTMGDGDKIQFEQWNDLLFHVNGKDITTDTGDAHIVVGNLSLTTHPIRAHRTNSNYSMTDGNISAPVIMRHNTVAQVQLPIFKYISKWQGSILLAGGPRTVDRNNLLPLSPARLIYFSQPLDPMDFAITTSSAHQTIAVTDDDEVISGIGIYSNSTGTDGPISQLLTTKKNKLYVLNGLPVATSGVLDPSIKQITLSSKIGCVGHNSIVNTPIGTVVVSPNDVYVIRGDGEPTPIGREISPILKGADLTNCFACYHDRHVKISFYHEDYDDDDLGSDINNVEFWLDTNKLIEQKGIASWVGPMIGYYNQYCCVEDKDGDGLKDDDARDRFCCDGYNDNAVRLFQADIFPDDTDTYVDDFGSLVECVFDTKDMEVTPQDNNWNKLIKRTYWKLRVCNDSKEAADIEEDTYLDGVLFETKAFEAYGLDDTEFYDQPAKLNRIFPTGRPRGRTVRKTLRTSARIGIAGFQLNYSPEKRRI